MIYLDNAATGWPKAPGVGDAMAAALDAGNPGRSAHASALEAGRLVFRARCTVAGLVDATPGRVVLTAGATAALNAAILGLVSPGDHVVTTDLEHNAVLRPLYASGARLTILRSERGVVTAQQVEDALTPATRVVAVTAASNVLGTAQPIETIASVCREHGVVLVLDASQAIGHLPIDVDQWGPVAVAFGAHKGLRGPTGIGVLALGEDVTPRPTVFGGTGFDSFAHTMPARLPESLEPGTPNLVGVAGLLAALGAQPVGDPMAAAARLRTGLRASEFWEAPAIDETAWAVPVVAGNVRGLESADVADALAERGIAVRAGFHCAPLLHERYGTAASGMVRFSPGVATTSDDIDATLRALTEIADAS